MKIKVETIQVGEFPNCLWVRVHTDEGLVGLGETFYGVAPVAAYVHETAAPYLLGKDPLEIERHSRNFMYSYLGAKSVGVEMRAASAIDIALWDLFGKTVGQPVYQLLGGRSREKIRVYNTCAGYQYVRKARRRRRELRPAVEAAQDRPYEDLDAFLNRADELALSLKSEGYQGMKIWPFDAYAEASNGTRITKAELRKALQPFEKIRKAVGDDMDIHVEFHSLWDPPTAIEIAKALEPFNPYWFEDPLKMLNLDALADYARRTNVRVTASERIGTCWGFRELLEKRAVSVVMFDIAWCGGLSEARKIAAMAEAYELPVAPHDCTGPVGLARRCTCRCAARRWCRNGPAFYFDWYGELVTQLPPVREGHIEAPPGPGLGTELRPEVLKRKDAEIRVSKR
jgi:L-alanine-DL-glutamate epimerase-like enolase superfamily enzyme